MLFLLILSTFTFSHAGAGIDANLEMPPTAPKALIVYFHRYVENKDAVKIWGEALSPYGYAVAGFTAMPAVNSIDLANSAIKELRKNPDLQQIPIVAVGASMGALTAAKWFASSAQVRALVLIVPGSPEICTLVKGAPASGRPVFLIQAEKDDLTYSSGAKVRECVGENRRMMLKGAAHIFPPDNVSGQIVEWLDALSGTEPQ